MKETIGNQYGINVNRLVRQTSDLTKDQKEKGEDKDRSYFCSELIAALYKRLGLLNNAVSAGQYWPSSFSQANLGGLNDDACLGIEYKINSGL